MGSPKQASEKDVPVVRRFSELATVVAAKPEGDGNFLGHPYWYIYVDPRKPRFYSNYRQVYHEKPIQDLAQNIAENGLCNEPYLVFRPRERRLDVGAGHRRILATRRVIRERMRVGIQNFNPRLIKAKVLLDISSEVLLELQLSENLYERPNPADDALAYYELWLIYQKVEEQAGRTPTIRGFAKYIRKPETTVRSKVRIIEDLHPLILAAIQTGDIGSGAGKLIAKVRDVDAQLSIYRRMLAKGKKSGTYAEPMVREWLQAHGPQEKFELEVQVIDEGTIFRAELQDGVISAFHAAVRFAAMLVRGLEAGVLEKSMFTPVTIRYLLRLTHVLPYRLLQFFGLRSILSVPARLILAEGSDCSRCPQGVQEACASLDRDPNGRCIDVLVEYMIELVTAELPSE